MARTIVGILRGGTSNEYNLSLKSGAVALSALPEERYETRDILIDKQGYWHLRGRPVPPARALAQVDVVIIALHGGVGEDGSVQRILDRMGIPYAGSRALPSGFALNKIRARTLFRNAGLLVPRGIAFTLEHKIPTGEMADAVFSKFGPPYVVKPPAEGASYGLRFAPTVLELADAIGDVLDEYGTALVEEYLIGEEVHAGVIENFRGEELYALPAAHVELPQGSRFFEAKHHEEALARHNVPSAFSRVEKEEIARVARAAHRALNLAHFSRADIILTRRGPYILEVNSLPGLYSGAALPPALESVGSSVTKFLEHAIDIARR